MRRGLIGYTGFVGSNLLARGAFDGLYRSSNIDEIRGQEFDLLVCAGAPAEKWRANRDPAGDQAALRKLTEAVLASRPRMVVLISTIDVYPRPVCIDEDSPIDPGDGHAYGRHRLQLERTLRDAFQTVIVRLPGVFGPGLKKNVIYDLLNRRQLDRIHPDSTYQFYDLRHLWDDIAAVLESTVPLMNLVTEPVTVRDVARSAFGLDLQMPSDVAPAEYDVRTRHDRLFAGSGGYVRRRDSVLEALTEFVSETRRVGAGSTPERA